MKINHLWISKYKNIENASFNFENKLISLLVGVNGLGKSNLLEALLIIFRELDLATSPASFLEAKKKELFDFKLDYQCKEHAIHIESINQGVNIYTKPLSGKHKFTKISFSNFVKNKSEKYFPDAILGYYSGENKRIKKLFLNHNTKRISSLKKSKTIDDSILGKLFFADQNFGELIFFTLWIYKNTDKYGEQIKRLLNELVQIDFSSEVEIDFCNPKFYKSYPKQNADDLFSNIQNEVYNPFWGIKGDIDILLQVLYNNHSEISTPTSFIDKDHDSSKNTNEFVQFTSLDFDELPNDLESIFDTPVKFFNVLHAAYKLGIIHQIRSTISKHGATISHNYSELSEGEQQLLTTIGLTLITSEYDTLVIFDEPDTHLNPQWQREYAQLIHNFTLEKCNTHILVATHSPLIVQAAEKADVFLFKKENEKVIVNFDKHNIHNWRIDQVLQSEYFEIKNTRPPSLDEFMQKREEILSKDEITADDISLLNKISQDMGELPSGETLNDFKTLHLLKTIVAKHDKN